MLIVLLHVEAEVTLKRLFPPQPGIGELHWNVDPSQHAAVFSFVTAWDECKSTQNAVDRVLFEKLSD